MANIPYAVLTIIGEKLRIDLTKSGRGFLVEKLRPREVDWHVLWWDFLEYNIVNSPWETVKPEEIGALTEAPILGYDVERDDAGKIKENGDTRYFWYERYQISDPLEDLLTVGYVYFDEAKQ